MSTSTATAQPSVDLRSAALAADDGRVQSLPHRQAIASALSSGEPDVRVLALRAIGRTQRAEFLPQALAGLRHASIDVRREAAFAVAHIGVGASGAFTAAERGLRDALGVESDALVFAALAEEYGRLPFGSAAGVEDAARTLRGAVTRLGSGAPVPPFAELGVARAAESLARRAAHLKQPSAELHALIAHLHDPERVAGDGPRDVLRVRIRRLAVSALVALDAVGSAQVGPAVPAGPTATLSDAFERAIGDADAQVRRLGVIGVSRRPALAASRALAWLKDEAMIVRHAVVSRLGPTTPTIAEAAIDDEHLHVRLAALDALGAAGACRTPCTTRLERPDVSGPAWHERAHALEAFARTDADAAKAHVTRALSADVWQVRMYAARAARYTGQADVLARLAADRDVNVRHAALVAWRAAALPGLADAAVAALASDDGQLLLEATTALRGTRGDATTVAALRDALRRATAQQRETSRDWRLALVERLDELDPDCSVTLRPYLSDFDPAIAERAAAAINARLPAGDSKVVAAPAPLPRATVPSWSEITELEGATAALRLRGNRLLVIRLYPQVAPTAVARFVAQVRAGQWNGRTFHRVEPGFVVQGGSPAANEYAGAPAFARDEFSALSHVRGTVGISTRGPDTGDGQIFINLVDNPRLDFGFTMIGSVTSVPALIDDIVEGEVIEDATIAVAAR